MQLSIKTIINISTTEKIILSKVFFDAINADYDNVAYSLTQSDANNVAEALNFEYENISPIGSIDLFGEEMTKNKYFAKRQAANLAMLQASAIFKLAGLQEPELWTDSQYSI